MVHKITSQFVSCFVVVPLLHVFLLAYAKQRFDHKPNWQIYTPTNAAHPNSPHHQCLCVSQIVQLKRYSIHLRQHALRACVYTIAGCHIQRARPVCSLLMSSCCIFSHSLLSASMLHCVAASPSSSPPSLLSTIAVRAGFSCSLLLVAPRPTVCSAALAQTVRHHVDAMGMIFSPAGRYDSLTHGRNGTESTGRRSWYH